MIRVQKPVNVPTILTVKGIAENLINCRDYDNNPRSYISNKNKFSIFSKIYNDPAIKKALRKAQHNKCCFCEKKQNDEYGAVEHFRPKLGYKSKRKEKLKKPGYYWQGYLWENLYFVCGPCNTKKGNIFPLMDETQRAKNHNMAIAQESPLLLNPIGALDPRDSIKFNNEFPIGITTEGKQTIEICKLDRQGLNEERKILLDEIDDKITIIISKTNPVVHSRAVKFLEDCQKKESKYSAVAIDYIKQFNFVAT